MTISQPICYTRAMPTVSLRRLRLQYYLPRPYRYATRWLIWICCSAGVKAADCWKTLNPKFSIRNSRAAGYGRIISFRVFQESSIPFSRQIRFRKSISTGCCSSWPGNTCCPRLELRKKRRADLRLFGTVRPMRSAKRVI